ncbi:hypothetical protein AT6N2_C0610 [Agrobacterium tumefaciens]|nr:hypothetical protein AT6N2_C0610 [Agrobacterium tumefaciens]
MAAGDVVEQRTEGGGRRRKARRLALLFGGGEAAGKQPHRGAFDITLAAGDLAGETQVRAGFQPQRAVEQDGGIDVGVAMQAAEACKFRVFKTRDHAEHIRLNAVFQLRLKTHHVVERAKRIILTQLHHGIGLDGGIMGVGQAHRFHRPVAQCLTTPLGHDLDRQAAIKIGRAFPFLETDGITRNQRVDEGIVLLLIQRAVDIILARATGTDLVVTRLVPADIHVDAVAMHDRGDGVEEGERILTRLGLDGGGKIRRGEGTGRNDGVAPFLRRQAVHLLANDRHQRVTFQLFRHGFGKPVAVDGKRAAGRHLVSIGAGHDQRAGKPHFRMNDTDRIRRRIVGAEGIGTDQFRQRIALMCVRAAHAAHFMQNNGDTAFGNLPCGFRAGQSSADDVNGRKGLVLHVDVHRRPRGRGSRAAAVIRVSVQHGSRRTLHVADALACMAGAAKCFWFGSQWPRQLSFTMRPKPEALVYGSELAPLVSSPRRGEVRGSVMSGRG